MIALITGIAGFAGSHLADFLLQQPDLEVLGIDSPKANLEKISHIKSKIRLYRCDICDFNNLFKVIKRIRPDLVFHLAAQAYVPDSWKLPALSLNTNIIGTLNLLESIRSLKISSRIQIACSAEEYGRVSKKEIPVKELSQFRPLSPYAVGKITQDMLGYQYYQNYQMYIVRTRAFNHLGPRMAESFVAANFSKQVALIEAGRQEPVIKVGNLSPVRDFTDVRDIVRGYWLSLVKCLPGEAYNLCSGKGYKINDLLDILLSFSNVKIRVQVDKARLRPTDVPMLVGDYSKFRRQTQWSPCIPIKKTLFDILSYWRQKVAKKKD
ncbi:MAG: GDP-mannose 4,6-dehydratase [Candidatus Omnitrophota bacterium]